MSLALTGIGVTSGIAIGQVHRLTPGELELPEYHLEPDAVAGEVERLQRAADRGERFMSELLERMSGGSGDSARELLEAHRLILRDPMLLEATCDRIRQQRINAEWALALQGESLVAEFRRMDDEYLALRREDLEQAIKLIQRELADQPSSLIGAQVPHKLNHTIIVAPELGPAEMAVLNQRRVAGLITEHGGPMSHSAILARGLEIPMIVGIHHAIDMLNEGESVILDGHYGAVLAGFEEGMLRHYQEKKDLVARRRGDLRRYLSRPSKTVDDESFRLYGNAELPVEIERCRQARAAGIGLMRTEYLFMSETLPDEETQYRAYRKAIEAMDGRPVTIRTLDVGGDKLPPALAVARGPNPALGLRGLRLSLALTDPFRQQLRAILRAAAHGPVRILLPMLTRQDEIQQARRLIAECRKSLRRRGVDIDPSIPVGGMIETPAAALSVERMAGELDFLSIGTNDLIQYVLAVDRQDELVSYLYDPAHFGVLELIERIVRAGDAAEIPVDVCGELAGDELAARLLLGLGVRHFSMPPSALPAVKKSLVEVEAGRCRELIGRYRDGSLSGGSEGLMHALMESGR